MTPRRRRKELAKTCSLLFFAERKAKYHAKVKSKAYARGLEEAPEEKNERRARPRPRRILR